MRDLYDYVIVGGGTAGCVLANRLSRRGDATVLLLEAGGPGETLRVRTPGMVAWLLRGPLDGGVWTEPQPETATRPHYWPRGRCLGGCSAINNMIYIRGHRDNYDDWRALGNDGWGYRDVLPLFLRSEDNSRGPSRYHGVGGELGVTDFQPFPMTDLLSRALAEQFRVPLNHDFNGASQLGFGRYQVMQAGGRRCSAARAFLAPARRRPTLDVLTRAVVSRVELDSGRARGVIARVRGRELRVGAAREVILCAGAIASPLVLLRSGVGPADELRAAGVRVRHELPGVGENLQDHLVIGLQFRERGGLTIDPSPLNLARWFVEHALRGTGPMRSNLAEGGGFLRLGARGDDGPPDIQLHYAPIGAEVNDQGVAGAPIAGAFSLVVGGLYPASCGVVRLRGADPEAAPIVDPRYLSEASDMTLLLEALRATREAVTSAPLLRGILGEELTPGPAVRGAAALREYIRRRARTIYHPVGTCRMGRDDGAVVDAALRVRGIAGLRVADASVMPRLIGGNTCAPTIMIAERAAELIGGA